MVNLGSYIMIIILILIAVLQDCTCIGGGIISLVRLKKLRENQNPLK